MFQNIKIDIIYYKTNADFELEFNLCGCCRMRLLTDKAPDKKTLIHALSRAVSRSRVIIISGSLSGENGIIDLVSHAVSKPLAEIDNNMYGIIGDENISVINGATPLVTPDGDFGGCIIESGPQSMILLTDDKAVRKTIMNNLIHPYVEELCALELKAKAAAVNEEPEPQNLPDCDIVSESSSLNDEDILPETAPEEPETEPIKEPEILPEPETQSVSQPEEPTEPETQSVSQPEIISGKHSSPASHSAETAAKDDGVDLSGGMIFETDDYRAASSPEDYNNISDKEISEFFNVSDYHNCDDESEDDQHRTYSLNIPILILSLILLLLCAVLCYCIFYIPASKGIQPTAYLQEALHSLFG